MNGTWRVLAPKPTVGDSLFAEPAGKEQFDIGQTARGDEVPSIDHGSGQALVIDEAAGAEMIGRARNPVSFVPLHWLRPEDIGDDVREILPQGPVPFTLAIVREHEAYFGPEGKFPAVHIASGRLEL